MKLLIIMSLLAMVSVRSAPVKPEEEVSIQKYDNDVSDIAGGNYKFAFEQSDGTKHEQEGSFKKTDTDDEHLSVKGSFSWVGPDGVTYTVTYVANKEGFQPEIEQGPGGAVPSAVLASMVG